MIANMLKELLAFFFRFSFAPALLRKVRGQNRVTIVVYHNPAPAVFERHLTYLARHFTFVSLSELVHAIRNRDWSRMPQNGLVFTFDDGHKGNYELRHLLRQFGVHATIFLCSHIIDTKRHYWWKTGVRDLERLKQTPHDQFLATLKKEVDYEPEKEYPTRQSLNAAEIAELSPYVEFGSHTRFHPILPRCQASTCLEELRDSRTHLEAICHQPVKHFAFPNGDYTERELALLQQCGYDSARTLDFGWNDVKTDPYRLKVHEVVDTASVNVLCAQTSGFFPLLKHLQRKATHPRNGVRSRENEMATKPEILMLGPYPLKNARGGIAAVIACYAHQGLFEAHRIKYLPTSSTRNSLVKAMALVLALLRFVGFVLVSGIKIVHIHSASWRSFYRKSLFLWLGCALGRKVILHVHGGEFQQFYTTASGRQKTWIRETLARPNVVVVVAESWKARLQKIARIESITVIPNPVNTSDFTQKAGPNKRAGSGQVVFMGKLCREKGVFDLLNAVPRVLRTVPQARFIICGDGELAACKTLCQQLHISGHVDFPGWVDERTKVDILRHASVFVLTSYNEGLPVSILEAMAAGLPVIASAVGGIPELIEHDRNGTLIQPGDSEAVAAHIVRLLRDDRLRHRIGRTNQEKVKGQYDIQMVGAQLAELYRSLLLGEKGVVEQNDDAKLADIGNKNVTEAA
ncbi:MAG: glycosyltransferase [bacterium]